MKKAIVFTLVIIIAWQAKAQSGWIPIQVSSGAVLIPVKINGHEAVARLVNALKPNYIDKEFVDKNNVPSAALSLQIGGLTVDQPIDAIVIPHQNKNLPNDLMLGDDIFKEFIVDIDFPHQRISFYHPKGYMPPAGIMPLAYKQNGESRAASVSIEGGPSMLYWAYLGDPAPISVYQSYAIAHAMLKGRDNSIRMGGGPRTPPEAIATIRDVDFAGVSFSQVPGVFPDDSVTGDHPAEIAGHIGLGILSRCRIIFDYSLDRLYVLPASGLVKAPFPKDRSGLVLRSIQDSYIVRFVCPGSPAIRAGFKIGDTVTQVNNQPVASFIGTAWQIAAWNAVRVTDPGATYSFTIKDGTVRKLTTADFF